MLPNVAAEQRNDTDEKSAKTANSLAALEIATAAPVLTDPPGTSDYYVSAQYYDVTFPAPRRDAVRTGLGRLLDGASRVLEIGSGTGLFTETLLGGLANDGEVYAVEPTAVMRAALVTRLAALGDPPVTVLADDALTAEVNGPLDVVVLLHVLPHFSPAQRLDLWQRWVPRIRHGGLVITDMPVLQEPAAMPATVIPGRTLGRRRYDTVAEARVRNDRMTWTVSYRVHEGDRLVSQESVSFQTFVPSGSALRSELREVGCTPVGDAPDGMLAWRRN